MGAVGSFSVPSKSNPADEGSRSQPAPDAAGSRGASGVPRRVRLDQLRPRGDRRTPPSSEPADVPTPPAGPANPGGRRRRVAGRVLALVAAFAAGALATTVLGGDDSAAPTRKASALAEATTLRPVGNPLPVARARATLTGQAFKRLTVNVDADIPRDYAVALVGASSKQKPLFVSFQRRGRMAARQPLSWRELPRYERLVISIQEPRGRGARRKLVPREVLAVSVDRLVRESRLQPE